MYHLVMNANDLVLIHRTFDDVSEKKKKDTLMRDDLRRYFESLVSH